MPTIEESLVIENRALQARVHELERQLQEQSAYIQTHGLTEYESARLKAEIAGLRKELAATKAQRDALNDAHANLVVQLQAVGETFEWIRGTDLPEEINQRIDTILTELKK